MEVESNNRIVKENNLVRQLAVSRSGNQMMLDERKLSGGVIFWMKLMLL